MKIISGVDLGIGSFCIDAVCEFGLLEIGYFDPDIINARLQAMLAKLNQPILIIRKTLHIILAQQTNSTGVYLHNNSLVPRN